MEYYLGKRSGINYAVESAWGKGSSATLRACPGLVQKFSDEDSQNVEPINSMCSETDERTNDEYYPLVPTFGATVETFIQHLRFLSLGIGPDSYSSTTRTHNISIGDDLRSFTMQVESRHSSNPFIRQYYGCMMSKVELMANKNDFLRGTANISAQRVDKISSMNDYNTTVDSLKKIPASQIRPYRSSDMQTVINGVDISKHVQQARVSIDNDLLIDEGLDESNGNYITEQAPQVAKIDASLTVKMRNSDLWDLFRAGDTVPNCYYKWTRGNDYIKISFKNPVITKSGNPIDITQGVIIQELTLDIPSIAIEEKNTINTEYSVICT